MADDSSFRNLIGRVRAGDAAAAEELVRTYEPTIRLVVRRRLTSPGLRRLFDSMDICQSVLASFFVRAASGQYDPQSPEQLLKLLAVMTRNKLARQAERQRAARRDYRRLLADGFPAEQAADPGPSPSQVLADKELLQEFRRRLTAEERWLADQRAQGRSWSDIAAEKGGTPDGLRVRLTRAIERVSQELGLDD